MTTPTYFILFVSRVLSEESPNETYVLGSARLVYLPLAINSNSTTAPHPTAEFHTHSVRLVFTSRSARSLLAFKRNGNEFIQQINVQLVSCPPSLSSLSTPNCLIYCWFAAVAKSWNENAGMSNGLVHRIPWLKESISRTFFSSSRFRSYGRMCVCVSVCGAKINCVETVKMWWVRARCIVWIVCG